MSDTGPSILISAYACEPDRGSEQGAGFAWLVAAAKVGPVTLITRANQEVAIRDGLASYELPHPVTIHGIESHWFWLWVKNHVPGGLYLYYLRWQRDARTKFHGAPAGASYQVVHHVTFACDWLPASVLRVAAPVKLWGPVGGSSRMPMSLLRWLGLRSATQALLRDAVTPCLRWLFGRSALQRATLGLALNRDSAKWMASRRRCLIRGNAVVEAAEPVEVQEKPLLYAGRLVAWKGVRLLPRIMDHPALVAHHLSIFGEGREYAYLRRTVQRLGLAERVTLHGQVSRGDLRELLRRRPTVIYPSFHDSAPWFVAEAVAAGCAVVCLDLGGVPEMAGDAGVVVPHRTRDLVGDLARAVRMASELDVRPPSDRFSIARLTADLEALYSGDSSGISAR